MLKKMIGFVSILMAIGFLNVALAHSALVFSSPANNAQLTEQPGSIHLEFNEEVRLLALELEGAEQGEVGIDFQRNRTATDTFHVELPNLADDVYSATWTLIGADGHRVSGVIQFTLNTAG